MSQDIIHFEDLLSSTNGSEEGYLIINSPGGDGNVAEKIITMCRQRFTKSFKVIVPNFAKSAATMIALGSDKILMGYLAELGPIDPQLGNPMGGFIPARSFIDGLEMIRSKIKSGDPVQMYLPMLAQIRPEILAQCQSAIDGSREFAEKWLKECMLKDNPNQAIEVAKRLSEGQQYKSHGKVIDYNEAHDVLKLNVEKIPPNSELWTNIWELYCRQMLLLQNLQHQGAAKVFESETASLTMHIQMNITRKEPQHLVPLMQDIPEPELKSALKPKRPETQPSCISNQPTPKSDAPAQTLNSSNEHPSE
jgi:ClpP class serine protease